MTSSTQTKPRSTIRFQKGPDKGIYHTRDLDQFKSLASNRPLHERHVRQLQESIRRHGFIPDYHLIVTPRMEVVDGQHRLEAARREGVEVSFSVLRRDLPEDINREMNRTGKGWQSIDYLDSYAQSGSEEYIRLRKIVEDLDVPKGRGTKLRVVLQAAASAGGLDQEDRGLPAFRAGRFKLPSKPRESMVFRLTLSAVELFVRAGVAFATDTRFVSAVRRLVSLPGYSEDVVEKKLEWARRKLERGHNGRAQFEALVDFYNYRLQGKNRIGGEA